VHPIVEDLKKQYGADIRYEVVTRGNVSLDEEAQIARRVKEIVEANHGAEFVIVPSGLPYIVTVVYNTVLQITSKHPVYLQLDREKGRYIEKTLDPRKLMF
jgi:2-hydroxy-3-keto-5-methylthiopentenyl-1-phosphate phosphatase